VADQLRTIKPRGKARTSSDELIRELNLILDAIWKEIDVIKQRLDDAGIP
jgi:hypothetical protein